MAMLSAHSGSSAQWLRVRRFRGERDTKVVEGARGYGHFINTQALAPVGGLGAGSDSSRTHHAGFQHR